MTGPPNEEISASDVVEWQPRSDEIEQRAVRGVALMVVRNVGVQGFTFMGTVALSHLLTPQEYGNFAIALTFQIVGRFLSDLGLAAAMIRRREEMSAREEQTVTAISVLGSFAVAGAVALTAFVLVPALGGHSELLDVAAVTSLALPFYSARVIPVVRLERRLDYRRLTWIEVADPLVFYAFAIPAALAGLGAYSLAGAVVAAAAMGSVIATLMRPWHFGLQIDLGCIRPMLGFSVRASILAPLYLLREFLVLVTLAAIGGPAQAGFYNLAQRLFSLNLSIAYAVQRVTQTAFARGDAGTTRDRRGAQTTIVTTLTAALPLTVVVGTAHISVGLVFGSRWHPTIALVVAAAAGWLLISGPISVLTQPGALPRRRPGAVAGGLTPGVPGGRSHGGARTRGGHRRSRGRHQRRRTRRGDGVRPHRRPGDSLHRRADTEDRRGVRGGHWDRRDPGRPGTHGAGAGRPGLPGHLAGSRRRPAARRTAPRRSAAAAQPGPGRTPGTRWPA